MPQTGPFTRDFRLRKRREFEEVYKRASPVRKNIMVIYAIPNKLGYSRLGLAVSRKMGNSVTRNRIKRLLREAFRREKSKFPLSFDIVVHALPSLVNAKYGEIADELCSIMVLKAGRLNDKE